MAKLPAIHLYSGDWLRDAVAGCSLAAQGLWLRMMFLGHDSDRYGYLSINGVPIPPGSIAQRCGCTLEQYTTLLDELDAAGVPSRTPEGIIYSRRMVRDAKVRELDATRQRRYKKRKKVSHARVTGSITRESEDEDEIENEVFVFKKNCEENTAKKYVNRKCKATNYQEVLTYCIGLELQEKDALYFWNHWEGNGWQNGGRAIRDWKRVIIAWKSAGHCPSQKVAGNGNRPGYESRIERTLRLGKEHAERIERENANSQTE